MKAFYGKAKTQKNKQKQKMSKKHRSTRVPFRRGRAIVSSGLLSAILIILATLLITTRAASASTNNTINFEARLLNNTGSVVPDGSYNIELKIYNAATETGGRTPDQGACTYNGGTADPTCLWTETRTGANTVTVQGGYMSLQLGSVTSFPGTINWDQPLWLSIRIGGIGTPSWDSEMSPRLPLTAVPYAFRSGALALSSGSNEATLSFGSITGNDAITLPDASGTVCLQSSSSCGFATGSGSAFLQGGNSFSAAAVLGTNDNNNLQLETDGQTRLTISNSGGFTFAAAPTISVTSAASPGNLTIQGQAANSGNTSGGSLVLQGGSPSGSGSAGNILLSNLSNFNIQNSSVVDLSFAPNSGALTLGNAGNVAGSLVLDSSSSNSTVTLTNVSSTNGQSYSLDLPTSPPGGGLCLETSTMTASQLIFTSCANANSSISEVQEADTHGTGVTTLSFTPNAVGDSLLVTTQTGSTSDKVTSVTLSHSGNTISLSNVSTSNGNTTVNRVEEWMGTISNSALVGVSSTITVTYQTAPTTTNEITATEFTALGVSANTTWGVDSSGGELNSSSSTSVQYPGVLSAGPSELYFGYAQTQASGSGSTCAASYSCIVTGSNNLITFFTPTTAGNSYQPTDTTVSSGESNTVAGLMTVFVSSTAINNSTTLQGGNFYVQAATAGTVAGVLQAASSGTADILDLRNSSGTNVVSVGNTGTATFQNSSNSSSAFKIQDASGNSVLIASTNNDQVVVGNNSLGSTTSPAQLYVGGTVPVYAGESSGLAGSGALTNPLGFAISNGYAYVANEVNNNLEIFSIGNPSTPTALNYTQESPNHLNLPIGVAISGHYAFVTSYGNNELVVYNIANPSSPVYVTEIGTNLNGPQGITISGNYAYILNTGSATHNDQVVAFNISNPTNPTYVGENTDVSGTDHVNEPEEAVVRGNYIYIADYSTNKIAVYDVTNPANITYVGENSDTNLNATTSISIDGNYLIGENQPSDKAIIYNLDSIIPTYVSTITVSSDTTAVAAYGNTLYIAGYSPGKIYVYNISNPASPVTMTNNTNTDTNISETFHMMARDGYLYLTDNNGYFQSYSLGGTYTQTLQVGSAETTNLSVEGTTYLAGDARLQSGLNVGGSTLLQGNVGVSGQVLLQNASNSTVALQIGNASGAGILNVDSTNNRVGIGSLSTPTISAATLASGGSLAASSTYDFRITAVDGSGDQSTASAEVAGSAATSGTCTTSGSCEYTLSWSAVAGAVSYDIYYSTASGQEGNYINTGSNATTYTFSSTTGNVSAYPPALSSAYADRLSSNTNVFQSLTNSTTAFQIQDASGNDVLTADTSNDRIDVGNVGTAQEQLYVGGAVPSTTLGSVTTTNLFGEDEAIEGHYAFVLAKATTSPFAASLIAYDISNPASPVSVSTLSTSGTGYEIDNPTHLLVQGNYAYVVGVTGTVEVFNITTPSAVTYVSSFTVYSGYRVRSMAVAGSYLYLGIGQTSGSLTGYLQVYNLSDPTNPISVDIINLGSDVALYFSQSSIQNGYLYAVNGIFSGGGTLYDFSLANPASPVSVNGTIVNGQGSGTATANTYNVLTTLASGHYVYIVEESSTSPFAGYVEIFDVSNPVSPVHPPSSPSPYAISGIDTPNFAIKSGNYIYVSSFGSNAISIINAANPASLSSIGTITATTGPWGLAIQGNYLYTIETPNSPTNITLQIFDLYGTYTQSLQAGSTETTSLQVDNGATISGPANLQNGLSVGGTTYLQGSVGIAGQVLLQNASNSTTALQVANASGTGILNVDSTNSRVGIGSLATPTLSSATLASGGSLAASTTYYFRVTAVDGSGGQSVASAELAGSAATSSTCTSSGSCEYSLAWGAVSSAVSYDIYYGTVSGQEGNYINTGSSATTYTFASTTGNTAATPSASSSAYADRLSSTTNIFQSLTNSTSAFQIQNSSGTTLLTGDTTNNRIDVGTLGTAQGQLFVGGSLPSSTISNVDIGSNLDVDGSPVTKVGNYEFVATYGSSSPYPLTLDVYDMSDETTSTPTQVATLPTSGQSYEVDEPYGMTINGDYLYIIGYTSDYVYVFNVSNPKSISYVTKFLPNNSTTSSVGNTYSIATYDNYLYIGVTDATPNGWLDTYNISNPASPTYVTGLQILPTSTVALLIFNQNSISGHYLNATSSWSGYSGMVYEFNLANPANPALLNGSNGTATQSFFSEVSVSQGDYQCVVGYNSTTTYLQCFNNANPSSPSSLFYKTFPSENPYSIKWVGNYLYLGQDNSALTAGNITVLDMTNPSALSLTNLPPVVGTISLSLGSLIPSVIYPHGNYLDVQGYTSSNVSYLQTYTIGGIYTNSLQSQTLETNNLQVDGTANLQGGENIYGTLNAQGGANVFGNVTFQTTSNSTSALQVQNASGTNLLEVDTTDTSVSIGTSSAVTSSLFAVGGTTGNFTVSSSGAITDISTYNSNTFSSTQLIFGGSSGSVESASGDNLTVSAQGSGQSNFGSVGSGVTLLGNTGGITLLQGPTETTSTAGVCVGTSTTCAAIATPVLLELSNGSTLAETASSCSASVNPGALYYNSNASSVSMRACINGSWKDVITSDDLGIMLFGVVPDSGANPGDLASLVTTNTTGPCKVSWLSTTSVSVSACTLYTGGRKIVQAATTVTGLSGTSVWYHLCYTGSSGTALAASTGGTETANMPTWSATAPILCLADVETNSSSQISNIYDTRVFTTDTKSFATDNTATGLSWIVKQTTTSGVVAPTSSATDGPIAGVVVAYSGSTSTTTPNVIIVTNGPTFVKVSSGTTADIIEPTTTSGYGVASSSTASTTAYGNVGYAKITTSSSCSTANNCQYSELTDIDIK